MNKQIEEALKMAIAEIEGWIDHAYGYSPEDCADNKAIQACEKALAEAEKQEPVALIRHENGNFSPAPSWQSLSDNEIFELHHKWIINSGNKDTQYDFARAVEQALKEKNHDD